ncbi:MAG: phosphotransferase family protein [Caldilineaceae bacterium]|nr:phosphotransferase family protein [Caldilineaceae bacterium]
MLDRSAPVRPGEELDLASLEAYLVAQLPRARGTLAVEQFPSGFSNLTYLLRLGDQELVLRRPPFGANIRSAHDMGREYQVLTGLARVKARTPRPLLYCTDLTIIGAPFYVMERLHGVILRAQYQKELTLAPDLMRRISLAAVDNLAAIHAIDYQAAGLADLGRPEGYIERQVEGWTRRYRNAQTDEVPELEGIMAWLATHRPATGSAALIHNDYKYDNLMLDPANLAEIVAVLDWEMCTIGDPLMDLGTTLGYWIESGDPPSMHGMFGLTALPGNLDREAVIERYAATSGRDIADPLFYYLYGLFKIAVIIQQIYARYRKGHTKDPRFAGLGQVVKACGEMARLALEKQRVSRLTS